LVNGAFRGGEQRVKPPNVTPSPYFRTITS